MIAYLCMIPYSSKSGKQSGATGFEIGDNYIVVRFDTGLYKYSFSSCGRETTETLKRLARTGQGLSTWIARHHPNYEWRH